MYLTKIIRTHILIVAHLPRVEGVPENVLLRQGVFCTYWFDTGR